MTVSFSGTDHTKLTTTIHGTFPGPIYLNDDLHDDFEDPRWMNLSCMNARAFLRFLGVDAGDDLYGELPMPEVRRLIIKAKATFKTRASRFVRHPETIHGTPHVNDDGTVQLRPIRVWLGGIDEDYLWRQLHRLEVLVEVLAAKGATHLRWG